MNDRDKPLKTIAKQNWTILGLLGCLSFFFMTPPFTLGVLVGGLIVIASFRALQNHVWQAFNTKTRVKTSLVPKIYFRLAILGTILYILITRAIVHPVGLTIGLSIVFISIAFFGIRSAYRTFSQEAT